MRVASRALGIIIVLALVVAIAAVGVSARAAVTVCVMEVKNGKVRVVRGMIAPRILSDIADVVAKPSVQRATVRITRSGGYARLHVKGVVPEGQRQQLRNVVGSVPLAQLARGRRH
jgi:hypothetical protein